MKTYPSSKRDKLIVAIKEGSRYCSVVPSRVSWPCQGNRPQEGSKLHSGCRGRPSPNPAVLEEDTSWTGWLHHRIEVVSDQRCFIVYCLTLCFLIGSHSKRVKPLVSFQFQAFLNAMSYQFCVMGIAKRKWARSNSLPVRYCFRKGKFFVLKDASSKSGRWIAMGPDRYTQVNYAILGLSRFRFPSSLSWLVILRYICLSTWNPNNLPT